MQDDLMCSHHIIRFNFSHCHAEPQASLGKGPQTEMMVKLKTSSWMRRSFTIHRCGGGCLSDLRIREGDKAHGLTTVLVLGWE